MKKKYYGCLILAGLLALSACGKNGGTTVTEAPLQSTAEEETKETEPSEESKSNEDTKAEADEINAPSFTAAEYPAVDGSTATVPLARMLYRLSTGADDVQSSKAVSFTKTTGSYINLMDEKADLVIAYEAGEKAKNDPRFKDLLITPVGLDALVFLCNEGNTVKSLSTEEIQDIYSGKITNWNAVGGADKEIIPFQRPENSGSQTLMENLMMQGKKMADAPSTLRPTEMGDLIEAVAAYNNQENALGYSVYYYARNMYAVDGIRFMAVDGILPENDTIQDRSYGYVNPFYAAIRKDTPKDSPAYQLYEWLSSTDGQSLVEEMGYVSVEHGGKKLPESLLPKTADDFHTDHILVYNSESVDGTAGMVVFDENMQPSCKYDQVRLDGEYAVAYNGTIPATDPEPVGSEEDYNIHFRFGLFDVYDGSWIVEPEYDVCAVCHMENGGIQYMMIRYDEEDYWEGAAEVVYYDCEGRVMNEFRSEDHEALYELRAQYYPYSEFEAEYFDGYSVYHLGEHADYARFYEEDSCVLYMDGKIYDQGYGGYVDPLESAMEQEFHLPYRYSYVTLYEMEPETYEYYDMRYYLLNEEGRVVHKGIFDNAEVMIMLTEDYIVVMDYESYEYRIMDMNGNLLYSWHYNEEYEWDWEWD